MCSVNETKLIQPPYTPLSVLDSFWVHSPLASPPQKCSGFHVRQWRLVCRNLYWFYSASIVKIVLECVWSCWYNGASTDFLRPPDVLWASGVHHILVPAGDQGGGKQVSAVFAQEARQTSALLLGWHYPPWQREKPALEYGTSTTPSIPHKGGFVITLPDILIVGDKNTKYSPWKTLQEIWKSYTFILSYVSLEASCLALGLWHM